MPENTTSQRGIEQGRAAQAYTMVKDIKDNHPGKWDEYSSGVKKLPVLIKTNGLGQALAFIQNRPNFPRIYEQLSTWLQHEDRKGLVPAEGDLVEEIVKLKSTPYRRATQETLAILLWMRRFVDGLDPKHDA